MAKKKPSSGFLLVECVDASGSDCLVEGRLYRMVDFKIVNGDCCYPVIEELGRKKVVHCDWSIERFRVVK